MSGVGRGDAAGPGGETGGAERGGAAPATARLGDRSLFPLLAPRAYLNHCAISPPSQPVLDAVRAVLEDYAAHGVMAFLRWRDSRERLRARLARLIGASAEDLAFMPNTTSGVIAVAQCVPWRRGDRVLLFEGEFPTNVTPWQQAAAEHGLELVWLPTAAFATDDGLELLERELRRGLRLVALSAVQFQTGLRMPWERMAALCAARGAEVFIDGIQALGVVPLDVRCGIDYLACGSHKWLMGTEGAGFLYVAPHRAQALRPRLAGWLSHEDAARFLFEGAGHLRYDRPLKQTAAVFEGGALNAAGLAALDAAVALIEALGPAAIFAHVQRWHDLLEPALVERGFTSLRATDPLRRSGNLSFLPPEGATVQDLLRGLGARGIAASIPDGALRFGPHWPNGLHEPALVVEALDALTGGGARA